MKFVFDFQVQIIRLKKCLLLKEDARVGRAKQ
jgi:hypothetical protein